MESASDQRRRIEQSQQGTVRGNDRDLFRLDHSEKIAARDVVAGDAIEQGAISEFDEIAVVNGAVGTYARGTAAVALGNLDDLIGLTERKRAEEYATKDTEDGRIGADASRQRNDGGKGEPWRFKQAANGKAEIQNSVGYPEHP
jgi:hypothetical protein